MSMTIPQLDHDLDALLRTAFRPVVDLRHGVAAAYEVAAPEALAALPQALRSRYAFLIDGDGDAAYLKLHYDAAKLRTAAALARNIGAVLIVGGVATWEEVETLICVGVEWAEGPLFGAAAPRPERLDPAVSRRLVRLWTRLR